MVKEKGPLFKPEERIRIANDEDRFAIRNLTVVLLEGRVLRGELDPDDDEAMRKAIKEDAVTARATYYATIEYLCG